MLPPRTHGRNLLALQSRHDVRLIELLDTASTERTVLTGPETVQFPFDILGDHLILTAHNIDHGRVQQFVDAYRSKIEAPALVKQFTRCGNTRRLRMSRRHVRHYQALATRFDSSDMG
jgi:hypothetical protein